MVLTKPILPIVPDVEVLCDLDEILAPVPGVLPFTVEGGWVLRGDVDVEANISLVVVFGEDKALTSD